MVAENPYSNFRKINTRLEYFSMMEKKGVSCEKERRGVRRVLSA